MLPLIAKYLLFTFIMNTVRYINIIVIITIILVIIILTIVVVVVIIIIIVICHNQAKNRISVMSTTNTTNIALDRI